MKISIALADGQPMLPALHQIGDRILFQPNYGQPLDTAAYAEVLRVAFDQDKVLYDLAITNPVDGMPYYAYPICSVDSTFVFTPQPEISVDISDFAQSNPVTEAVMNLDAVVNASVMKSESKGKKSKKKSPRQMLYSVMMREMAGKTGDRLAELMAKGDEDTLQSEFGKSVTNMLKDFKSKMKS